MARKRKLAKTAKRIARKVSPAKSREQKAVAAAVEIEFPPRPVSLTRQIAARLKNIRELQGVTLAMMEERTGMKKANLSRFENKTSDAKLSTLEAYAAALGVVLQFQLGDLSSLGASPELTSTTDVIAAKPKKATKKKVARRS